MADNQIIPLTADSPSSVFVTLEGAVHRINTRRNETDKAWYMDLINTETDQRWNGIKLVLGVDLIFPYGISILGRFFMIDESNEFIDPTETELGDRFKLVYILRENKNDFL